MHGLSLVIALLFGAALLSALVVAVIAILRRPSDPHAAPESAGHTWRTAVPWLVMLALMLVLLLGLYALTR